MSLKLWNPGDSMSPIAFEGHIEFRDMFIPVPSKNEWGVDILERVVRGPGVIYEKYLNELRWGKAYSGNKDFFLQSWRPIDHPIFPGFQLSYKGFIDGRIPDPLPSTTRSEIISVNSAQGLSISYGDLKIVSASREVKQISPTTVWRYISKGEPGGKRYEGDKQAVRGATKIEVLGSRIIAELQDDDGNSAGTKEFYGNAPAGLVTALFADPVIFVIGPNFFPILGTPYYECEEICQLKYPDSA